MPPSPSLIGWDALGGAFVATKDQGSLAGQGGESRYRRRGGADGPPPTCAELHTSSSVEGSSGCIERSERSMQGGQTWVVSISRPSVKPRSSHSRTRNLGKPESSESKPSSLLGWDWVWSPSHTNHPRTPTWRRIWLPSRGSIAGGVSSWGTLGHLAAHFCSEEGPDSPGCLS